MTRTAVQRNHVGGAGEIKGLDPSHLLRETSPVIHDRTGSMLRLQSKLRREPMKLCEQSKPIG